MSAGMTLSSMQVVVIKGGTVTNDDFAFKADVLCEDGIIKYVLRREFPHAGTAGIFLIKRSNPFPLAGKYARTLPRLKAQPWLTLPAN
jgi:hypothetical protein